MPKRLEELSDEELMRLYQDAREDAFNVLYQRHSGLVYGYLRKRLPSPQAANDVFQAAFLKLHRSKDQFNGSFAFMPWMFTVVKTSLYDWQKNQNLRAAPLTLDENLASPPLPESVPTPDLSVLPEAQRTAVELRYLNELSFEEIAARLNTTPGNARQIVSRAIKGLKALLVKEGGIE
jgi:RNA polymerase sigma-70 factor (ECF subfamily)